MDISELLTEEDLKDDLLLFLVGYEDVTNLRNCYVGEIEYAGVTWHKYRIGKEYYSTRHNPITGGNCSANSFIYSTGEGYRITRDMQALKIPGILFDRGKVVGAITLEPTRPYRAIHRRLYHRTDWNEQTKIRNMVRLSQLLEI
jgi:hypothetical protein